MITDYPKSSFAFLISEVIVCLDLCFPTIMSVAKGCLVVRIPGQWLDLCTSLQEVAGMLIPDLNLGSCIHVFNKNEKKIM